MKVLSEKNASALFGAEIPSTKERVSFRPMTVGMRKTLAKFAIGDDTPEEMIKFQTAKMALLKTLCISGLDDRKLTEIDFISLLACVRNNSSIDDLILNMTCGNAECKKEFTYNVDFEGIIDRCSKFEFKKSEHVFKDRQGTSYRIVLEYPSAMDAVAISDMVVDMGPEEFKLTYPYIFVKSIFIEDDEIEDFAGQSLAKRIEIVDGLPGEILYNVSENNLYKVVYDDFGADNIMNLYGELKCPGCGKDMEGVVTSDNFFTI